MFVYFRNYSSNIMFAVKIVRLKVYMTIAIPTTLTFVQGHKCVSNLLFFNLQYLGQYLSYCIQSWRDGRLIDTMNFVIMLTLILMTLTLMQGHSGSAKSKSHR